MRITYGSDTAAASTTRYEVAWSLPQSKLHRATAAAKISWWLDSHYSNEQAACGRLKELQNVVSKEQGSIVVYQVNYDDKNTIVSERVVARLGSENPPFRVAVLLPNKDLKAAFAQLTGTPFVQQVRRKPLLRRRLAASFIVAGGFAGLTYLVVVFAGPAWLRTSERPREKNEIIGGRNQSANIIVPRPNSELCDRFLFDNSNGAIRSAEAAPCNKSEGANITKQVNSFSSSWRGWR